VIAIKGLVASPLQLGVGPSAWPQVHPVPPQPGRSPTEPPLETMAWSLVGGAIVPGPGPTGRQRRSWSPAV